MSNSRTLSGCAWAFRAYRLTKGRKRGERPSAGRRISDHRVPNFRYRALLSAPSPFVLAV